MNLSRLSKELSEIIDKSGIDDLSLQSIGAVNVSATETRIYMSVLYGNEGFKTSSETEAQAKASLRSLIKEIKSAEKKKGENK